MAGPFALQLEKNDPLNHTKQHEKANITKEYFGAVSCDLVDRPCLPQ